MEEVRGFCKLLDIHLRFSELITSEIALAFLRLFDFASPREFIGCEPASKWLQLVLQSVVVKVFIFAIALQLVNK